MQFKVTLVCICVNVFLFVLRWKTSTSNEGTAEKKAREGRFSSEYNTYVFLKKHLIALSVFYYMPLSVTSHCFSQRRIVMLSSEVDRGIEMWKERQEEAKQIEEHKKSLLLKPKGKLLMKKNPQS